MPARMIQNSFGGGELSPVLHGRSDLQAYYRGCASAENFVVTREGTLRKRRGIRTGPPLPAPAASCRVFAYRHDRLVGAAVVFSVSGSTVTATLYDKALVQRAEASFAGGGDAASLQAKQIGDQLWVSNGSFFRVVTVTYSPATSAAGESWALKVAAWKQTGKPAAVKSFACTGYSEKGTAYDGDGETAVYYCAFVVKDGVASAQRKAFAYQKKTWVAGAYVNCTVTLTAAQRDAMDYVVVGKSNGGPSNYGELARYYAEDFGTATSVTFVDRNVSPGDAVYAQTNVLGNAFANPLCVDCFQQRKVFANASADGGRFPMTMWFSEVGNLDNFYANRPTVDSDAFSPTIGATGPAFIRWVCVFQESMVLLTDCGLFSVGFAQTAGFSASSCRISRFSQIPVSGTVAPVVTDAGVVFVGADGKTLYTVSYDLQDNAMRPVNRSVLVEHLTRTNRITGMALQEYPDSVVWLALEDGSLATFTYERSEEVYAWSHGRVAGARVLDAVSLGTVTDGVGGRTYTDLVFVVEAGDGAQYLARAVPGHADEVAGASAPVVATLRTLRPESQERTLAGRAKNVKDVLVRLYETGALKVAPARGGAAVPLVAARAGAAGALFTGDVKVMPAGYVNGEGQMEFVSDDANPCEILTVVSEVEVG